MSKIILASASHARQAMLNNAGLVFDFMPADIDETGFEGDSFEKTVTNIAAGKAVHVSHKNAGALVIGSDQILVFDNEVFTKAQTHDDALAKLKRLNGQTHRLYSGVTIAREGAVIWSYVDHADLTMHNHDDGFLNTYTQCAGDVLTSCVGAYAYEAHGAWLFKNVSGNYFTILGMPLLPLLDYLHTYHGVIPCKT